MAKAKANLRAVYAENEIKIQTSRAAAEAMRIAAQGRKNATVIEAQGQAEARKIEAKSRNEAARTMTAKFAREYARAGQQVEFAKAVNAQVLTVIPDSNVGRNMAIPMLSGTRALPGPQ